MSPQLTFFWRPTDASIIDPASLTDRTWTLESVGGAPASSGSLRIVDGTARRRRRVHAFSVPARVGRGAFTLSHVAPPRASLLCTRRRPPTSFLSQQPAAWVVRDGKLIVYGGGSQAFALVYRAEQQQTTATAIQGQWTLAKVFDANGGVRPATAPATLDIAANGTVTGTDGCRTFHGTVSTSGSTATFSLTMPEPACSPIIEQTAGLVDRVLERASVVHRRVGRCSC